MNVGNFLNGGIGEFDIELNFFEFGADRIFERISFKKWPITCQFGHWLCSKSGGAKSRQIAWFARKSPISICALWTEHDRVTVL